MIHKLTRLMAWGLPAAIIILAGCATPKTTDTAALQRIHQITVILPSEPGHYTVASNGTFGFELMPEGSGGGANDGLVAVHGDNAINQRFRTQMTERHVTLGVDLGHALAQALTQDGYTVTSVALPATNSSGQHTDLSTLQGKADAVLDIIFLDAGYAYHTGHPYQPAARVQVRLIELSSHQVLFEKIYSYGNTRPKSALRDHVIPPALGYEFRNGSLLLADPDKAAAGLRTAPAALSAAISADLKRP
jgi:hypothetical protein